MRLSPTLDRDDDELVFPELSKWIGLYLHDCKQQLYKPATILHYQNALKRFDRWYDTQLDKRRIDRRNGKQFAYWLSEVKDKCDDHPGKPTEGRLSPVTVRRTVGVVRTFLRWLYRENYLQRNLADWFPLPRTPKGVKKLIEPATLAALFEGASKGQMPIRDTALISLLADTGLRRTEIATVTAKQVKFLDEQSAGYLHNVFGKHDSFRDVPFSSIVGELIQLWLEERDILSEDIAIADTLFVKDTGQILKPGSIYEILLRCARRANVLGEVWNTHSLRHSFATNFWRIQRGTKSLSMILGHSGQRITEDFYVHPVPHDLLEAHTSSLSTGQVSVQKPEATPQQRLTKSRLKTAIEETPNWRILSQKFEMSDVGVRKMAERFGLLDVYYEART